MTLQPLICPDPSSFESALQRQVGHEPVCQPLLRHCGTLDHAVMQTLFQRLRGRLDDAVASATTRRKLYTAFVEIARNVHDHGLRLASGDASAPPAPVGALTVAVAAANATADATADADVGCVIGANLVHERDMAALAARLRDFSSLSAAARAVAYRRSLATAKGLGRPGPQAGFGLLAVAREACEPLQFDCIADNLSRAHQAAYFVVKVRI